MRPGGQQNGIGMTVAGVLRRNQTGPVEKAKSLGYICNRRIKLRPLQLFIEPSGQLPERAVQTEEILLSLTRDSLHPREQPCPLEVAKLQVHLIIGHPQALGDFTRVGNAGSLCYSRSYRESVPAAKKRLGHLA